MYAYFSLIKGKQYNLKPEIHPARYQTANRTIFWALSGRTSLSSEFSFVGIVFAEESSVKQMSEAQVAHGMAHCGIDVGETLLQVHQQVPNKVPVTAFAQRLFVGARANLGEGEELCNRMDFGFAATPQRSDEPSLATICQDIGSHGFESATAEERDEETGAEVVEVLAESEFVAMEFCQQAVELSTTKS